MFFNKSLEQIMVNRLYLSFLSNQVPQIMSIVNKLQIPLRVNRFNW